ncbi:MAG: PIG-L deacetylase family protein [Mucilaginibacter sp.]
MDKEAKTVAIIVAHPDDEILWSGGSILSNPHWRCFIASLCRKNDPDRAPKFRKVLTALGAKGLMGDLDDGPDQIPLNDDEVESAIMDLLPPMQFDLVLSHSIYGEYTRHRRHEEIGRAVIRLWSAGKLQTKALWAFAFEDGGRSHFPAAINNAPLHFVLPAEIWKKKYNIITDLYGFAVDSWEARSTPAEEAFWQFLDSGQAYKWLCNGNIIS